VIAVPLGTLVLLPFFTPSDPAPSLTRKKSRAYNLDCERMDAESGSRLYPGLIEEPKPRGDYVERSVVVCRERLTRPGLRLPGDEAVLSALQERTVELAEATASARPDLQDRTWLVEAHHAIPPVVAKVTFATKNALMGQGLVVSDRTPALSAGDVDVLTRMPPDEAHPAACRRYADNGSLHEGDALLVVVQRDVRETALHAGLCDAGVWTWLR
jgi:hypothetical protein